MATRLLLDLALVLGVGTLTGLLFRWMKLPVILGYVLAGVLVGPHVPVPLVADERTIQTLSDLGVALLMFSLGLEFSLKRLFQAGPTALLLGSIQVGLTATLGMLLGRGLGFSATEALFVGPGLAISSTMVVGKLFEERRPTRALREVVFSVLIVQDLFAILLLTVLGALVQVGGSTDAALGSTLLRLGFFLGLILLVGRLTLPRFLRWVADHERPELLLLASTGICFVLAVLADAGGFSVALGAFSAGMLAAESGRVRAIERQVWPLRDLFTAVFFVAVGMQFQPAVLETHLGWIVALTALVVGANAMGLFGGGLLGGLPIRTSVQTALSLSQSGEFAFILLGVGVGAGAVRPELYSVTVAVGMLTTLISPFLMQASGTLAETVEARLPASWRISLGLYQAWAESLRRRGIRHGEGQSLRRPTLLLLLDTLLLMGWVAGGQWVSTRGVAWLVGHGGWGHRTVQGLTAGVVGLGAGLLVLGMLRQIKVMARDLAVLAPSPEGGGSGRRGRHLLAGGLRVGVLLMVGLPLVAALQPLAPRGPLLGVALTVFSSTLIYQIWKARTLNREFPGVIEWLWKRVEDPWSEEPVGPTTTHGTLRVIRLGGRCPSLGRRLADLNLPGRSGVSVVALLRDGQSTVPLRPSPVLQEGDLLALTGPEEALDEAETILGQPLELPGEA